MGVTKGLFPEFGEARVIDTPITESAIMGAAAGAAARTTRQTTVNKRWIMNPPRFPRSRLAYLDV